MLTFAKKILEQEPVAKVVDKLHRVSSAVYKGDIFERFELRKIFRGADDITGDRFKNHQKYLLTDQPIPGAIMTIDNLTDHQIKAGIFYIYFTCDSDALPFLRRITALGGKYVPHISFDKTDYRFVERSCYDAMRRTWAMQERVSHLTAVVHENICEALAITEGVEGDYVEIGVYRGGSALTAINYLDIRNAEAAFPRRKAWLLDTFDGFNYDEAFSSSDAIWAGTHALDGVDRTMSYIRETLSGTSVPFEMFASNICTDQLPAGIEKIAVANIDVDMYDPTRDALAKVSPLMVKGGIIICEDAASTPGLYGALVAMEDFLETDEGRRYVKIFKKGQVFLLKTD